MDKADVIAINKFHRIRVNVDVSKPFHNSMTLKLKQPEVEMPIKYEKSLIFCYACGFLGHGEKDYAEVSVSRRYSEKLWVNTPWKLKKGSELNDLRSGATHRLFMRKVDIVGCL